MKREDVEALYQEARECGGSIGHVDSTHLAALCRRWLAVEDAPTADVQMLGNLILSDIDNGCLALIGQRVRIVPDQGEGP